MINARNIAEILALKNPARLLPTKQIALTARRVVITVADKIRVNAVWLAPIKLPLNPQMLPILILIVMTVAINGFKPVGCATTVFIKKARLVKKTVTTPLVRVLHFLLVRADRLVRNVLKPLPIALRAELITSLSAAQPDNSI